MPHWFSCLGFKSVPFPSSLKPTGKEPFFDAKGVKENALLERRKRGMKSHLDTWGLRVLLWQGGKKARHLELLLASRQYSGVLLGVLPVAGSEHWELRTCIRNRLMLRGGQANAG